MKFSIVEISKLINGTIDGDENVIVSKISKIEEGEPGSLSFLANPKYTPHIYTTKASAVIVNKDFVPEQPVSCSLIRVEDAYAAFAGILGYIEKYRQKKLTGISPQAHISSSAQVDSSAYIGEFSSIGEHVVIGRDVVIHPGTVIGNNVQIGEGTLIYPGVRIYSFSRIGKNCTIHAGVVIGSDGFGFAPQDDNNYMKISQIGNVIIHDNVEIGANTTIDRATFGSTIIHKGVKLDNLIQIAHNVEIGENTVIAALTGIAGSAKVGANCMIGGQVGIVGHIHIGDNVKIAAQSGIVNNVPDNAMIMGSPAIDIKANKRAFIHYKNLDSIVSRLNQLEKEVKNKLKP